MLFDELKKEQMECLRTKNTLKRSVLELVTGKAMLVKIEKRTTNEELTDDDVYKVIAKVIKELKEEAESFEKAGRSEKVAELNAQQEMLQEYLPKQLTKEEIKGIIDSLEDQSMPAVMKHFKMNYSTRVDMRMVQEVLSGK